MCIFSKQNRYRTDLKRRTSAISGLFYINFRAIGIIATLIFIPLISYEQAINDSIIPKIDLAILAQENSGNSYITFPTDIGDIEPLWFEANLIPNFHIRTAKDARLMAVLTPQIIIRMYQEESFPVRTPSYMPQLTVYYSLANGKYAKSMSAFGKIAHHSNGQEDNFYNPDGSINTHSGNFSTNYFELGLVRTHFNKRFNAVQFFSTSFEVHPKDLTIDELDGIYSLYRWNNIFSIFKLPSSINEQGKKRAGISLKGELTWMFGELYDWECYDINRANVKLTFFYHPKFLEEIGFFAQIYHGMDYYNIYFDHQIMVLRFGIMTEKLSF